MPATTNKAPGNSARKKGPKKSRSVEEGIKIKYSDKSPGQPELVPIFEKIKQLLAQYDKGNMKFYGGSAGKAILISKKPVVILGRKRDELWFASALVQKGYVGFYFMPVYTNKEVEKLIRPELLKCLKGKACFHIKKFDTEIFSQIKDALKMGYNYWKNLSWV